VSQKVTLIRQRVVEEKVEATISTPDPADAVAVTHHLVEGQQLDWKYNRTLEVSDERVQVKEIEDGK
jgi:hypothetical protein